MNLEVNAGGALVDLRFCDDINDLDYDEITAVVLTAEGAVGNESSTVLPNVVCDLVTTAR
jgi:hypothetical protein